MNQYTTATQLREIVRKLEDMREQTLNPARRLKLEMCIEDAEEAIQYLLSIKNEDEESLSLRKFTSDMKYHFLLLKLRIVVRPKYGKGILPLL